MAQHALPDDHTERGRRVGTTRSRRRPRPDTDGAAASGVIGPAAEPEWSSSRRRRPPETTTARLRPHRPPGDPALRARRERRRRVPRTPWSAPTGRPPGTSSPPTRTSTTSTRSSSPRCRRACSTGPSKPGGGPVPAGGARDAPRAGTQRRPRRARRPAGDAQPSCRDAGPAAGLRAAHGRSRLRDVAHGGGRLRRRRHRAPPSGSSPSTTRWTTST